MSYLQLKEFQLQKREKMQDLQKACESLPQIDIPAIEIHADNTYGRGMHVKAGDIIVGKTHTRDCINVISKGTVRVVNVADEKLLSEHTAPDWFISPAGTKRAIVCMEDACWMTFHNIQEDELEQVEQILTKEDA